MSKSNTTENDILAKLFQKTELIVVASSVAATSALHVVLAKFTTRGLRRFTLQTLHFRFRGFKPFG